MHFSSGGPKRRLPWAVCAIVAIVSGLAYAQEPRGEIRIEVKDASGAAVAAGGRLRSLTTGVTRHFSTDPQGIATLREVPYGRYLLEISKSGFDTQATRIDVASPEPVSKLITLEVGSRTYKVDVVATTPLAGSGLLVEEIPAPVQTATQRDIEQSGAADLSWFLNQRFNGVSVNEIQGNPFQPDVNYRGYTASPLLGTPQGLSVYMDGVRLNQPFGDVVSWDLIPRVAILETTLMPGSDPLFGLNTLGGALSIQTKDGHSQNGTRIELSGGSFGRKNAILEHGGANSKGFDWYVAANLFFDDGWRERSPTDIRQFFGRLGWQRAKTVFGLSLGYANNSLTGNGVQDLRFLDRGYASVYTTPDITDNQSPAANLTFRHAFSSSLTFSGNAYYRYIQTKTFNGDINEDSLDQSLYQPNAAERAALTAAGYTGFPVSGENAANTPFPYWRCIAQSLLRDEPAEKCNGLLNRGRTKQHNYGLSGQAGWFTTPGGQRNQLTAGAAYDGSSVGFEQLTQLGYVNPDRSVTGVDAYGDGVTGGDSDGVPYDTRVNLAGRIQTASLYAANTYSNGDRWNFTLSGRYNRTAITNRDRINPGGGPDSLDGHHVFNRFNPAAGLTFRPVKAAQMYFSYSEGSRAPTSIELGCSDPDRPCKLPNAMAGDPPLQQVVTRTIEAGVRGMVERNLTWSAGWFLANNRDDILFVAAQQTGFGYFKNFGKTRRQGLQIDVNSRTRRVTAGAGYTFLDATFQSPETVNGDGNSTNDEAASGAPGVEGSIQIVPGNRLPLTPRHMAKAYADIQVSSKLAVDLGLVAFSSSYARGNENNLHEPDGKYYLGPGSSPGYAVVHLGATYQLLRRVQLFCQINNLFDRHYYSAALLGATGFTDSGSFIARPFPPENGGFPIQHAAFFSPGAPRGIWGGIRFRF